MNQARWMQYKSKIIKTCSKILNITLFPKQSEIINNDSKFQVVRASRRTGKSISAAFYIYCTLFLSGLTNEPARIAVGAPNSEAAARIWSNLHGFLTQTPTLGHSDPTKGFPGLQVLYDNYHSKSTHKKRVEFENGSVIITASNDDYDTKDIRGDNFDLIIWDEFGQCPHKEGALDSSIPALEDKGRLNEMWLIGSPETSEGETFDRLFDLGQNKDYPDVSSWYLHQDDNPHLNRNDRLDRKMLSKSGYLREKEGMPAPKGQPMFEDIFNSDRHVKTFAYNDQFPYYIGIDFGPNNCLVIFYQYYNNNVHVFYVLHIKNSVISTVVQQIQLIQRSITGSIPPALIGVDPAGDHKNDVVTHTAFSELKKTYPQSTYTRSLLRLKINQTNMLKTLMLQDRLYVSDINCNPLIKSISLAVADTNGGWKKENNVDHPLDALCYGLINHKAIADEMLNENKSTPTLTEAQRKIRETNFFGGQ